MFFQLSRDKTLHNVLLKHDLDSETRELVENQASVSMIKKSLISNMDSTNISLYRKLIEKTILKEKEDYGEFEGDTRLGGDQKYTTSRRKKEQEQEATRNKESEAEMQSRLDRDKSSQMSAEQKEKWEEETEHKKAQNEITFLTGMRDNLNNLISNVRIQTNISPPAITGSKGYNSVTRKNSEFLIKILVKMSTLPDLNKNTETNFIVNRFKKFSLNGEFAVYKKKMFKKEKGERTIKNKVTSEINIFDLNNTFNNFANAIIDNTPSNKDMSLVEILGLIHLREFNTEPPALAKPKQIASDFRNFANKIASRDYKGLNTNFAKTSNSLKRLVSDINKYTDYTNNLFSELSDTLEKFSSIDDEYLLKYAEEILTERANELAVGLKVFRVKAGSKELPEYAQQLKEEIDELRQNPEKQLNDIKMDLAGQWLELKEDYSRIYDSLNMAFMRQLAEQTSTIETLILDSSDVENPSKQLSSKLSQLKQPLRKLFTEIKSLIKNLSDLDEDTKEKWNAFLAVDGEGLQEMKVPKREKQSKGNPFGKPKKEETSTTVSTIGARIDRTMRVLMEVSEEQAKSELSKLGVDIENVSNINVSASKIEDMFDELSNSIEEINSLLPEASVENYTEEEYQTQDELESTRQRKEMDYDIPSWIQEDFNPETQMGGKAYGDD